MTSTEHPLSKVEFDTVYSKVPRLTVEVIISNEAGSIYLTKRALEPCKGQWHLPGGTVSFGELLFEAVRRIAKRELGIDVIKADSVGYIEYPSHFENGLDSPVGIVFEVKEYSGVIVTNEEAQESGWFTRIPENMHAGQDEYLLRNNYLHK